MACRTVSTSPKNRLRHHPQPSTHPGESARGYRVSGKLVAVLPESRLTVSTTAADLTHAAASAARGASSKSLGGCTSLRAKAWVLRRCCSRPLWVCSSWVARTAEASPSQSWQLAALRE